MLPGGWLRTGDIGVMEADGLPAGRPPKDLIVVSGGRVYPSEVETVVADAGVLDCAAVGLPIRIRASWSACRHPARRTLDEKTIVEHCRTRLTGQPSSCTGSSSGTTLPRNPLGNIAGARVPRKPAGHRPGANNRAMGQRIAIISALHEERAELLELARDNTGSRLPGASSGAANFTGTGGRRCCRASARRAAWPTTAVLLERFRPQQVLFTGVAGGVGEGGGGGRHRRRQLPAKARHGRPRPVPAPRDAGLRPVALCGRSRAAARHAAVEDAVAWLPVRRRCRAQWPSGCRRRACTAKIVTGDRFVATAAESRALRFSSRARGTGDPEKAARGPGLPRLRPALRRAHGLRPRADDAAHVDFPAFLQQVAPLQRSPRRAGAGRSGAPSVRLTSASPFLAKYHIGTAALANTTTTIISATTYG